MRVAKVHREGFKVEPQRRLLLAAPRHAVHVHAARPPRAAQLHRVHGLWQRVARLAIRFEAQLVRGFQCALVRRHLNARARHLLVRVRPLHERQAAGRHLQEGVGSCPEGMGHGVECNKQLARPLARGVCLLVAEMKSTWCPRGLPVLVVACGAVRRQSARQPHLFEEPPRKELCDDVGALRLRVGLGVALRLGRHDVHELPEAQTPVVHKVRAHVLRALAQRVGDVHEKGGLSHARDDP